MKFEELPKPIEIGKSQDLSGEKYGELTVLFRVPNPIGNRSPYWACYCSCGEYCIKKADSLKRGESKCCDYNKHNNLVGQKYGQLIVVKRTDEYIPQKKWKYLCLCSCGNPNFIPIWDLTLRYGHVTSCGCARMTDIGNQRFGMLTALEPTDMRDGSSVIWKCQCDCGDITYKSQKALTMGLCHACPKHHISVGELNIKQILENKKIKFVHNKKFQTCKFPDTNKVAMFDFYLNDSKTLIEFDGTQHIKYSNRDWNTKEKFINTHNHDLYKNQWAWDNKIPMKRIPYTERDTLTLERIMSDEFLITPQTHPEWYPPKDSTYPYFTLEDIDKLKEVS